MDRQTEMGCVGMLSFMEPAPLSGEAAKVAGRRIASLDEADRTRLTPLALVAATAIERGEPICTREPESFRVFGVEAVRY